METLYRRPLPADAIAFSSPGGRRLFGEALAAGGLDGYFPLAEQFHTQAEPAFCGLGSLVVALNALAIDPGRLWKGPWRWFAEELLDCCVSLDEIRRRGVDLDELACLARCNGVDAELHRVDIALDDLEAWRRALALAADGAQVVIASYDRAALDQTGAGHFSPIGGFHVARDLALVLDVARFKYPPHWLPAERLWRAMAPIDAVTGRSRGWIVLRPRAVGVALGFTLTCEGGRLQDLIGPLAIAVGQAADVADLGDLARILEALTDRVAVREPTTTEHRRALVAATTTLRGLPGFARVALAIGDARAERGMLLALALADRFPRAKAELAASLAMAEAEPGLAAELGNLRAQLDALQTVGQADRCRSPSSPC